MELWGEAVSEDEEHTSVLCCSPKDPETPRAWPTFLLKEEPKAHGGKSCLRPEAGKAVRMRGSSGLLSLSFFFRGWGGGGDCQTQTQTHGLTHTHTHTHTHGLTHQRWTHGEGSCRFWSSAQLERPWENPSRSLPNSCHVFGIKQTWALGLIKKTFIWPQPPCLWRLRNFGWGRGMGASSSEVIVLKPLALVECKFLVISWWDWGLLFVCFGVLCFAVLWSRVETDAAELPLILVRPPVPLLCKFSPHRTQRGSKADVGGRPLAKTAALWGAKPVISGGGYWASQEL